MMDFASPLISIFSTFGTYASVTLWYNPSHEKMAILAWGAD